MSHWKLLPFDILLYGKIKFDIDKSIVLLASLQLIAKIILHYIVVRICVHVNTGGLVWELISVHVSM